MYSSLLMVAGKHSQVKNKCRKYLPNATFLLQVNLKKLKNIDEIYQHITLSLYHLTEFML